MKSVRRINFELEGKSGDERVWECEMIVESTGKNGETETERERGKIEEEG